MKMQPMLPNFYVKRLLVFNQEKLPVLFNLLAERFDQEEKALNQLDASVGDGDHGTTVNRAFQAAAGVSFETYPDLGSGFDAVSLVLAEQAGGAIGPLLAAFFAELGVHFSGKQTVQTTDLAEAMRDGIQAIQQVGGASVGQKTLLDALVPAVQQLLQTKELPLKNAMQQAASAARQGAEATKEMVAQHGRAHFLGQRSKGYQDAGATSIAILFETWLAVLEGVLPDSQPKPEKDKTHFVPPVGKLINHPDDLITQDQEGLVMAFPQHVALTTAGILVRAKSKAVGKVGLAIGHGGGHTPSMGGFIGTGLLDADVYGPLFTCASGIRISQAIQAADKGAGVVLLVSNHSGDVLNARLAVRRAVQMGIQVTPVYLGDDIATAPRESYQERRGLGGLLFALKIGGAAAEAGESLPEVVSLMERTNRNTATLAVAVRPPTHPVTGEPLFSLPPGEIEIGTGVHGEVGVYRGPHLPADQIVDLLLEKILADLAPLQTGKVLAFLNGSGGTSKMELHILYRRVKQNLEKAGITLVAGVVDSLFTTLEMGGFSLSICAVDKTLTQWWQKPAQAPYFRWPV
ncbi:MAG: dihydroxyacetone kinase subunit L [Anaerolineaceae bacterium]|nr:dihydroxyacetone kinase subunit L [Anaerolineaceae bacterium]